jgi:hypothetical protein
VSPGFLYFHQANSISLKEKTTKSLHNGISNKHIPFSNASNSSMGKINILKYTGSVGENGTLAVKSFGNYRARAEVLKLWGAPMHGGAARLVRWGRGASLLREGHIYFE